MTLLKDVLHLDSQAAAQTQELRIPRDGTQAPVVVNSSQDSNVQPALRTVALRMKRIGYLLRTEIVPQLAVHWDPQGGF